MNYHVPKRSLFHRFPLDVGLSDSSCSHGLNWCEMLKRGLSK